MENAYFLLFNGLSDVITQLVMLEASLMVLQRRAEELYIEDAGE